MQKSVKDMNEITETIFLGNISASDNVDKLKEAKIGRVLSVTGGDDMKYYKTNIKFRVYKIMDYYTENIYNIFKECIEFIDLATNKEKVLVYCRLGSSRSATIVIAYLMWKNKWSYEQAFDYVSKIRDIMPNNGFIQQLKLFDKNLKESNYKLKKMNFNIQWKYVNEDKKV